MKNMSDVRMQSTAILTLQEASGAFLTDVLHHTNLCVMHAKRVMCDNNAKGYAAHLLHSQLYIP